MGIKADLNSFIFIGHLVKDAELVTTANGVKYSKFTVANNSVKKRNDQYEQYTNYFDLKVFGNFAESINKYLVKGQTVAVKASVEQSRWEANGEKRSANAIIVHSIQLIGGKNTDNNSQDVPELNTLEVPVEVQAESQSDLPNYDVF